MRHLVIAIAAGLFAVSSAYAEQTTHDLGGPIQVGSQCWVSTNNDMGYGYWAPCPNAPVARKHAMKH